MGEAYNWVVSICLNFNKKGIPWTIVTSSLSIVEDFLKTQTAMAAALKRLIPLADRVLVQRGAVAEKTAGGIYLPEKSAKKNLNATVIAVGPGQVTDDGKVIPVSVAVGDSVLLPEYGGTKVETDDGAELLLFRDGDLLGKWAAEWGASCSQSEASFQPIRSQLFQLDTHFALTPSLTPMTVNQDNPPSPLSDSDQTCEVTPVSHVML